MKMLFESLIAHNQGCGDKTEDWEQVFYMFSKLHCN